MEWICQLSGASVARGDKVVLDDVTLSFSPGAKIGVVGPNGSGKSTLLQVMAGLVRPFSGDARLAPDISVGLLEQDPVLDEAKTVLGNVRDGVADTVTLRERYEAIAIRLKEECSEQLMIEMGSLQDQLDINDAWDIDARLKQAMDALCCPPPDAEVRDLSEGERRRVALCRLLIARPHLLLLDEPTNHLDAESVQWLEHHLATYLGTVVAVTHDRYFLGNVSEVSDRAERRPRRPRGRWTRRCRNPLITIPGTFRDPDLKQSISSRTVPAGDCPAGRVLGSTARRGPSHR